MCRWYVGGTKKKVLRKRDEDTSRGRKHPGAERGNETSNWRWFYLSFCPTFYVEDLILPLSSSTGGSAAPFVGKDTQAQVRYRAPAGREAGAGEG